MDAAMAETGTAACLWNDAQESAEELLRYTWRRELPTALALLDARAAIHLADKDGRTPLHVAVECAMPDLVARLIQEKADVNRTTKAGRSPVDLSIYWAVRNPIHNRDSTAIIRLLLSAGGLAAQEMWPSAGTDGPHQITDQTPENERIWTSQCRRTGKLLKEWYVPPPGSTSEVRLDGHTAKAVAPRPDDMATECVTRQGKQAAPKSCDVPTPATGIEHSLPTTDPGGSDQEGELTDMINQLTEDWVQNEVVSVRIPIALMGAGLRDASLLRLQLHHSFTPPRPRSAGPAPESGTEHLHRVADDEDDRWTMGQQERRATDGLCQPASSGYGARRYSQRN